MTKRLQGRGGKRGKRIESPAVGGVSSDTQPPVFGLCYLDGDYCVSKCTKDEKAAFADKLRELSQLSWRELRQAPRDGLGYEKINRGGIHASIPPHITEEVSFIAFRFCGKAPMVGYRDESIFHIVWIDRAFRLYDHE